MWYYHLTKNNKEEHVLLLKFTNFRNCYYTKGKVYVSNNELESMYSYFDILTAQEKKEFQATLAQKVSDNSSFVV